MDLRNWLLNPQFYFNCNGDMEIEYVTDLVPASQSMVSQRPKTCSRARMALAFPAPCTDLPSETEEDSEHTQG
jgi:hypothetical protein